jgi:hypothetical protein
MKSEIEPVKVFAGTIWQAEMVKSLLENAEIESFLNDEFIGTLAPWNVSSGGAGAVKIFVSSQDSERAKQIVKEYEENLQKENLD